MEFDDVNATAEAIKRRLHDEPGEMAGGRGSMYRVRARFYAIRQVDGESAYDWYRRVSVAAVPCRFGGDVVAVAVADKFVTGLRPGPVAERLLGEPTDGPPEDLLAIAVAVEGLTRHRSVAGADTSSAPVRIDSSSAVRGCPPTGTARDGLIDELREGLKLYRYSSEGYARQRAGSVGGCDDSNNGYNLKSLPEPRKTVFIGNIKSTLDEKSWWKNKIERKSKQLENNITGKKFEKCLDDNNENILDNSNCYCSSSWITNDECQEQNLPPMNKSKKSNSLISNCLDYTKKIECCVCNA